MEDLVGRRKNEGNGVSKIVDDKGKANVGYRDAIDGST
jgi:hypothetical protein